MHILIHTCTYMYTCATDPKNSALIGHFCGAGCLCPYWLPYFYHSTLLMTIDKIQLEI